MMLSCDHVMSVREVSSEKRNGFFIVNGKLRCTGTYTEPDHMANFVGVKENENLYSIRHKLGREIYNLENQPDNNEVLQLHLKIGMRIYINIKLNLIVGWESQSKLSSHKIKQPLVSRSV